MKLKALKLEIFTHLILKIEKFTSFWDYYFMFIKQFMTSSK